MAEYENDDLYDDDDDYSIEQMQLDDLSERADQLEQKLDDIKQNKPREEDYDTYEEYIEDLTSWKVDRKLKLRSGGGGPQPIPQEVVEQFEAGARQAVDIDTPDGTERLELVNRINDYMSRALTAETAGDTINARLWKERAAMDQRSLEKLGPTENQKAAEQRNIADLKYLIDDVAMDSGKMERLVAQVGKEKALSDTRLVLENYNRLSDGKILYVIKGDSRYGNSPEKIDVMPIELSSKKLADSLRYQVQIGANLWDELNSRGAIKPSKAKPKKAAPTPESTTKDPKRMTQAEFEAWRRGDKKEPKHTSAMHVSGVNPNLGIG